MKKEIPLIALSVIIIVSAQMLLKYGLPKNIELSSRTVVAYLQQVLLNPYVISGMMLFVLSAALWLIVLSKVELSYAYPALSLGYVLAAIGAWLLFNENINLFRFTGIVIICIGVAMLSRS